MRRNGVKNEENNPREIEKKVELEFCVSIKLRPNDVSACLSTALRANPQHPSTKLLDKTLSFPSYVIIRLH